MTRQEMLDYATKNWGLENEYTIALFVKDHYGDSDEQMAAFIEVVERLLTQS